MNVHLASPRAHADYTAIAALHNAVVADPISADELYAAEQADSSQHRRMIILDSADQILGTSVTRPLAALPGTYYANVSVALAARQHGLGRKLYADLEAFALAAGAQALYGSCSDQDGAAYAFAEACGFTLAQHWRYFALDLATFDSARFQPTIAQVTAQGIRFFSLADVGNTPENQQKLYNLNRSTSLDAPGEDSFPALEEFISDICLADWFRPDGQIIAAAGDDWIGLGAVSLDGATAHNAFTGVLQTYRRRHIAEALVLHIIDYAQRHAATSLQVFNDARNVGMIGLQTKLGYQPIPGRYVLTKQLAR